MNTDDAVDGKASMLHVRHAIYVVGMKCWYHV